MGSVIAPSNLSPEYLAENIGWRLEATATALIVLQTVGVILRHFSRRLQKTSWIWGDIFVPAAWLTNVGLCALCFVSVNYAGDGRHIEAVSQDQLIVSYKIHYYAMSELYCLAVTFPKLAILDVYLHVFVDPWSRRVCYVTGSILILAALVNMITNLAQCQPISHLWDQLVDPHAQGHCNNVAAHFLFASLPSTLTDVVMLVLPLPMIWRLQAPARMKLGILATFLTGSVGMITSILRFVGFIRANADATWIAVELLTWTIVEPGTYTLAACFITYRPLLRFIVYSFPVPSIFSKVLSHSSSVFRQTAASNHERDYHSEPGSGGDLDNDINRLVLGHSGTMDSYVLSEQSHAHPTADEGAGGIHVHRQFGTRSDVV